MWKDASPEESAPPRGRNLVSVGSHQLGRAGSCDMMHSLGGSWSASVFSAQAAANCPWLGATV